MLASVPVHITSLLVPFHVAAGALASREWRSYDDPWVALNSTVGGRLRSVTPLALPCFSNYDGQQVIPDAQACSVVQQNYSSATFRSQHYGVTINGNWDTCMSRQEQCLLDCSDPTDPLAFNGTICSQGSISQFYASFPQDVIAAFAFSEATGTSLSIKNSGHDYKGRSMLKGSLALWMHNVKSLNYNENFVPAGCSPSISYDAITAGAGNSLMEVYEFADEHNVTVVGGFATTIAYTGGWLMGGGHSQLTPVYGLGVDRVLEFKVVTPDGQLRVANECQNTDLFWALRGGGGGTFGVVLEATSKVEKQITIQSATITFADTLAADTAREFYQIVVNNSLQWASEGWGGFIYSGMIFSNPRLSYAEAENSLKEISDFAIAHGGNMTLQTMPSFLSYFNARTDVANLVALGSRLIPKDTFMTEEQKSELVDLVLSLSSGAIISFVTPVLFNGTDNSTSVTPAWRDSIWHLLFTQEWQYNATISETADIFASIHNYTQSMKAVAPQSGAYQNEADVYETDHETSFWGVNYPALLKIKQKYDPKGLLDCWHCVGWKGASADDFECYLDLTSL
ncbi:hypothetical protein F5I97DRAFT_1811126 [Phlebopus sp. FC_14]|nr:hypothetical protein F5I97DRAFT_1811126 [Phlebopus sp. FC_14]